jgi:hypothetical protein
MNQVVKGWSDKGVTHFNMLFGQVKPTAQRTTNLKQTGWKQGTRNRWRMAS